MMDADFSFIKIKKISWNFLHRDYTQYWDLVFLGEQVGRYEYKFIVDGNWVTNPELPLSQPNREGQVNNYLEVWLTILRCAMRTIILDLQNSWINLW